MTKNIIEFRQLTSDFYKDNQLVEMLDKGIDKGRGYGVLLVDVKGVKFAIPVRSKMHINHKFCFTTRIYEDKGKRVRHGLDYSKAVIIKEKRYVSQSQFFLENRNDYNKINRRQHHIKSEFEKYIEKYIKAVQNDDQNILREYRYSTLQNYHDELNLNK